MTQQGSSSSSSSTRGLQHGAVVWDLGNVLIRWDPRNLYRQHFAADQAAMEAFLSNVCTMAWNEQMDAGKPFATATEELSLRYPEHRPLIAMYAERWAEMLGGAIDANVELLQALKARGTPLYALTNWSAETFPIAQRLYPFLALFDGIVVSGHERLIKPDPAIFRLLLERFRLAPESTYFIDDAPRNIAAARSLNLKAIHYTPETKLDLAMFAS